MIPANQIKYRLFPDRKSFRHWLERNHQKSPELWLGFAKKGSKKRSIANGEAVEEALCFGWINGKVRKLDDELYLQRFSPRHDRSIWSEANKKRVKLLIKQGLMTEHGLAKIQIAKKNGSWDIIEVDISDIPSDLMEEFSKNRKAFENFQQFTKLQRRDYLWWIADAKRSETRKKRISELIQRAQKKIKPGNPLE